MGRKHQVIRASFFFIQTAHRFPPATWRMPFHVGRRPMAGVEYRLPPVCNGRSGSLSVFGPPHHRRRNGVAELHGSATHWPGCLGIILLGVVHALDAAVLSRWASAPAGRLLRSHYLRPRKGGRARRPRPQSSAAPLGLVLAVLPVVPAAAEGSGRRALRRSEHPLPEITDPRLPELSGLARLGDTHARHERRRRPAPRCTCSNGTCAGRRGPLHRRRPLRPRGPGARLGRDDLAGRHR